jgi:hypothetical protein
MWAGLSLKCWNNTVHWLKETGETPHPHKESSGMCYPTGQSPHHTNGDKNWGKITLQFLDPTPENWDFSTYQLRWVPQNLSCQSITWSMPPPDRQYPSSCPWKSPSDSRLPTTVMHPGRTGPSPHHSKARHQVTLAAVQRGMTASAPRGPYDPSLQMSENLLQEGKAK